MDNWMRMKFDGAGFYGIPEIERVREYEPVEWAPFNYLKSWKDITADKGVHFYLDDYQFTRLWSRPDAYVNMLRAFRYMLSPDFSLFCDMPKAMQIYNHYRKHWLGAYYAMNGIAVIPTISWSDEDSYDWCFDGEPNESVVSVSTVGCCGNKESRRLFLQGYRQMVKRLRPVRVLCYGRVMAEIRDEVEGIGYFAGEIRERVKVGHTLDGQ